MTTIDFSRVNRWGHCPAAYGLDPPDAVSRRNSNRAGDAAREVTGLCLTALQIPEEFLNKTAPNGVTVTVEIVEAVSEFLGTLKGPMGAVRQTLQIPCPGLPGATLQATPELRTRQGPVIEVTDFSYSRSFVPAVGNLKLTAEAMLAWSVEIYDEAVTSFTLTVVQPRCFQPGAPVSTVTLTAAELINAFHGQVMPAVGKVLEGSGETHAGKWCKYCAAITSCPASSAACAAALDCYEGGEFFNLPPDELAAEISLIRVAAQAISIRKEAIEAEGMARMERGEPLRGFGIEQATGTHRRWTDPGKAIALGAALGVDLTEGKPCTPAEAERRLTAAKMPPSLIKGMAFKSRGKLTLVESSPREIEERFKNGQ